MFNQNTSSMSPRESSILLLLKERGPTSFIQIGSALEFDTITTIRTLNELSASALVTIKLEPGSRGAAVYCLTERGKKIPLFPYKDANN